jgi:GDP-mannose 6-dehydrogenase
MKNVWVTLLLFLPLRASPISDNSPTVYLGAGDSLAFEVQTSSFNFNAARYGVDPLANITFTLITAPLSDPASFSAWLDSASVGPLRISYGMYSSSQYTGRVSVIQGQLALTSALSAQILNAGSVELVIRNDGPDLQFGTASEQPSSGPQCQSDGRPAHRRRAVDGSSTPDGSRTGYRGRNRGGIGVLRRTGRPESHVILKNVTSSSRAVQAQNVAVLGLGYVGCVSAACLAHTGCRVTGVDRDTFKVDSVMAGRAPFFEPGLEELVREAVAAGRLSATVSLADALADADVALVCVGTPSEKNGNLGLEQLRRVSEEIAQLLPGRTKRLIVAIRSTVYPGTCQDVVLSAMGGSPIVSVVSNPEFLREGTAVKDFMEPSLLVVGSSDPAAAERVAALYSGLPVEPSIVALRTAELIKYACNAFHAVKIAFANEIGALAGQLDIDGAEVMDTLCRDHSLNISRAYLKPGFAFGGSCLPKDLRALVYRASRLDLKLPLLESVLPANQAQLDRAIRLALDLPAAHIGVFGLAFKENTDDLRESPVVLLLETMIGKGRKVRVYDPHIQLSGIYGSNERYIMNAIPHIGNLMDEKLEVMLGWADHVLIAQKPSPDALAKLEASGKPLVDLVGALGRPLASATPA